MKNIITAIILILAMLLSLSSCLTALNKSGENVTDDKTDDIKESETEKENETSEQSGTSDPNEEMQEITEPVQTESDEQTANNPEQTESKDISLYENGVIPEYPSEELLEQIAGKANYYWDSKYISRFYGQYGDAVVVKFGGGWYGDAETEYDVAGYHFASNTTNVICVLENDNILTLPEAYRNGILTEEDIANIAWLQYFGKYVKFSRPE